MNDLLILILYSSIVKNFFRFHFPVIYFNQISVFMHSYILYFEFFNLYILRVFIYFNFFVILLHAFPTFIPIFKYF